MNDSFFTQPLLVDLPYPAVTVTSADIRYTAMLSDAYAGKGSETTAASQYRAHRVLLKDFPELYENYKILAVTETLHQELLGSIVWQLGTIPKLCSCATKQFWSGSFIHYRCQLLPILKSDAQEERNAIAHYHLLIACIPNESMQALFKRILLDEERHLAYLEAAIQYYSSKPALLNISAKQKKPPQL